MIWNDIRIIDYWRRWFSKNDRVATGFDILKWVKEHISPIDSKAISICKSFIEVGLLERVDGDGTKFEATTQCMLWFYEDWEDIADNMLRPWKGEVDDPLVVSS